MAEFSIVDRNCAYMQDRESPSKAIDVHHIVAQRSTAKGFIIFLVGLLVLAIASYVFLVKDKSITSLGLSFLLSAILIKRLIWNSVVKESVVVMQAFGVQLETHYKSGRIVRRFVPIGKILKPVLLECVTPVTCYWSLSLILCDKGELMLVFKELHPPVKMLVPIWKALCVASGSEESSDIPKEND